MSNQISDYSEDLFRLGLKALILNDKKEILLLRVDPKNRKFNTIQAEYWDMPGGQINYGESLKEGLQREVFEETNLSNIKIKRIITSTVSKNRILGYDRDIGLIILIFHCSIKNEKTFKLSAEHLEYGWKKASQLKKLIGNKYDDIFIKQIKEFIQHVN